MGSKDALNKLDEMILFLSEQHEGAKWRIHLQENLARELFGLPVPEEYKGNRIVIDNDLQERKVDDGWESDVWVTPSD